MSGIKREDAINEFLKGDERKNALDFIAYLGANDITPQLDNKNMFYYQDKFICRVTVKGADIIANPWMVWFSNDEGDKIGLSNVSENECLK